MLGEILELWIVSPEGLTMFNARAMGIQESVNPNLLSGFINAIRGMIQVSTDSDIESMNLSEQKLIFQVVDCQEKKLLYIARAHNRVKDKNIKKQLQKIAQDFYSKYGSQAAEWQCDTALFEGFEKDLSEYFVS
jgi:hypothetical protein